MLVGLVILIASILILFFGIYYVIKNIDRKIEEDSIDYEEEMKGVDIGNGTYKVSILYYISLWVILGAITLVITIIGIAVTIMSSEGVEFFVAASFFVLWGIMGTVSNREDEVKVIEGYVEVKKMGKGRKIDLRDVDSTEIGSVRLSFRREGGGLEVDHINLKYKDVHKLVVEIDREIRKYKGEKEWYY